MVNISKLSVVAIAIILILILLIMSPLSARLDSWITFNPGPEAAWGALARYLALALFGAALALVGSGSGWGFRICWVGLSSGGLILLFFTLGLMLDAAALMGADVIRLDILGIRSGAFGGARFGHMAEEMLLITGGFLLCRGFYGETDR